MRIEEVRHFWTKVLGIHGPQWMIVMALQHLDQGESIHVQAIADLLQVNPTFVTSQSRFLENKGLIERKAAGQNPTGTMLSLTERARRLLAELDSQQES